MDPEMKFGFEHARRSALRAVMIAVAIAGVGGCANSADPAASNAASAGAPGRRSQRRLQPEERSEPGRRGASR
jgi:hypothetical protein